jgi:dUTP pyrophosphatase
MKVKIKLGEGAKMPKYAHDTDAGLDLTCIGRRFTVDKGTVTYFTGVSLEVPEGYVGLLFPRSSVVDTALRLANSVGVIDSGYRGEISFVFDLTDADNFESVEGIYKIGERIGQLVIVPIPKIELEQVEELNESDRGEGGYGSTGK